MKIIGFRSNKKWKKIIATFGYLMIVGIMVSAFSGNGTGNNSGNNGNTSPVLAPVIPTQNEIVKDKTEANVIKAEVINPDKNAIMPSDTVKTTTPETDVKSVDKIDSTPVVTPVAEVKSESKVETKQNVIPIKASDNVNNSNSDVVVYRGKTGTKYHKSSCRTLKNTKIEMTLDETKSMGLEACKVCNP